jgi:hypothetical protein
VSYDRLDWHVDSAIEAGQPPENGFTHIGLYLAWLIRRDLHDPASFSPSHVAAVKAGAMTGTDLSDEIDGKLVADLMSGEGRAFSDARYAAYTAAYEATFADDAPWSIADDDTGDARISPVLDELYATWVADGRPGPAPNAPAPTAPGRASIDDRSVPDAFSMRLTQESMDRIAAELKPAEPRPQRARAAAELEALIPADLTNPPLRISSVPASEWGSSLLRRAFRRLGVPAPAARVVNAMGGAGVETLVVTLYAVPAVDAEWLVAEFGDVITLPQRGRWAARDVAGREVQWATGQEFTVAFWATDGLVVHVAGRVDLVEAAIPRLP